MVDTDYRPPQRTPAARSRIRIMRTQFVQTNSRACAKSNCAWAAKVVKVDGGYMCFEGVDDYNTWRRQK